VSKNVTEYHYTWQHRQFAWKYEAFGYYKHSALYFVALREELTANQMVQFMVDASKDIEKQRAILEKVRWSPA